jgi:hypothetical protein
MQPTMQPAVFEPVSSLLIYYWEQNETPGLERKNASFWLAFFSTLSCTFAHVFRTPGRKPAVLLPQRVLKYMVISKPRRMS